MVESLFPSVLSYPCSHEYSLTPLSRVDDDNFAERPISLIVVHADFHFKWRERREGLVPVFVHGGVCRRHHLLLPASGPVGTKCDNVPKALAILELLRYRLQTKEKQQKKPVLIL